MIHFIESHQQLFPCRNPLPHPSRWVLFLSQRQILPQGRWLRSTPEVPSERTCDIEYGITQNRNAKSTEPRNPSGKFSILTCLEPTETKTNIQKNLLSKIDNLETSLPPLETFFPLFHKRQASAACITRTATLLGSLFLARNFSLQLSNTKLCQYLFNDLVNERRMCDLFKCFYVVVRFSSLQLEIQYTCSFACDQICSLP